MLDPSDDGRPVKPAPLHDRSQPFPPGHTLSLRAGATSPRTIGPLAAEIEATARALPAWPGYLEDPTYAPAVKAWAWSEAQAELLRRYVAERDLDAAMSDTETSTTTETTDHGPTRTTSRKVSEGKRTRSALDHLDRIEKTAANHRARLGLDPLSRARLGRDVTASRLDLAAILSTARERHDAAADAQAEGGGPA